MFSGRQLRQFVAVAEELHVGRAADRLGMAQSPLSQAIRGLEQRLGVPLFSRNRRGVALTDAGAVFLAEARAILLQEEQAIRRARWAHEGGERLTLGFVGSLGYTLVPGIVRGFHESFPQTRLSILEESSQNQMEALRAGRLDLGIIRPSMGEEAGLSLRTIARERMVIAMPRGHRLAHKRALTLGDFAAEKFVLFAPSGPAPLHAMLMAACGEAGFVPSFDYEVRYLPSAIGVVASGAAVALLPAGLAAVRHDNVSFRRLSGNGAKLSFPAVAAWRTANDNPNLARLLQVIRDV